MYVGADIIGTVKSNKKLLYKDTINNLKQYWPRGYHLVLKRNYTVPRYRLLIAIFIGTEDSGSTKVGITYLSSYPYQLDNVSVLPVANALVKSKLFQYFNEVDSQNKSRQSDLVWEKYWVTNCGQIWLFTMVDMGTNIANLWIYFIMGLRDITMKYFWYEKTLGMTCS